MGVIEYMQSSIPEGESGRWKVERFTVSDREAEIERMRAVVGVCSIGRAVPAGVYTRLVVNLGGTMMSDTPDELHDNLWPVMNASGTCLVSGLGLGCTVEGMLSRVAEDGTPCVDKVIVLEKSKDVIKLVGVHLMKRYGPRLEIRNVDAREYRPPKGEKYGLVWHDIWLDSCEDNLVEMTKLHRRYARRTPLQGSWRRSYLRSMRDRRKREEKRWIW